LVSNSCRETVHSSHTNFKWTATQGFMMNGFRFKNNITFETQNVFCWTVFHMLVRVKQRLNYGCRKKMIWIQSWMNCWYTNISSVSVSFTFKHLSCSWSLIAAYWNTTTHIMSVKTLVNIIQVNQLPPNAFKKTYAYRSNSFWNNHLPKPEELEW